MKGGDSSLQFIQNDIQKMKKALHSLEERGNQVMTLIPSDLSKNLREIGNKNESIMKKIEQLQYREIESQIEFVQSKYTSTKEKVERIVSENGNQLPNSSFLKSYSETLPQMLLANTEDMCNNLLFYVESQLNLLEDLKQRAPDVNVQNTEPVFETQIEEKLYFRPPIEKTEWKHINEEVVNQMKEMATIGKICEEIEKNRSMLNKIENSSIYTDLCQKDANELLNIDLQLEIIKIRQMYSLKKTTPPKPTIKIEYASNEDLTQINEYSSNFLSQLKEGLSIAKTEYLERAENFKSSLKSLESRLSIIDAGFDEINTKLIAAESKLRDVSEIKAGSPVANAQSFKDYMDIATNGFEYVQKTVINQIEQRIQKLYKEIPII